ncbi:RNA polymerase II subunit A C-terminal domain phosphatase [Lasiodiplodia hormozganensis]|uniref:RNA polymerase II subunit A C-terminal domain phosphatase n=1 Tax=Lasiodiplodia hormozganensis TaxID=869390 RepID=A0AA40CMW1_9PEZI|nr:RNA polymerase II subunit A C-terminal domain phosphatase [Lasiodiplodia hormozganensis]
MRFNSPRNLHYPITVTKLLQQQDDKVKRFAKLFSYYYTTSVTEVDEFGQENEVEKKFPADFQAEKEGTLRTWFIREGDVIEREGVKLFELNEECSHEVQWGGMCVNCGKNMDEVSFNTTMRDIDRATVVRAHGSTALKISEDVAIRAEEEAKRRLLSSKKLSLVVDLDQTIIHATVDPTVAEWQKDPDNPNYDAVKDVQSFQLLDNGPGGRGCWYYIKLRPGLREFLENISKIYELHIYTMGTRAYAQNIAKIVDPNRKIFGDRILSRDESGSLTVKTLHRIFPVDTKMVVIIDDRGDVWNWHSNLIKVTPYDFFVGIGDINSSFLPKRHDIAPADPPPPYTPPQDEAEGAKGGATEGSTAEEKLSHLKIQMPPKPNSETTSLEEQLVAMSGGDNPELLKEQTDEQNETIATQMEDKPLLRRQEILDKADQEAAEKEESRENGDETPSDAHRRHNLLHDDDEELAHLEANLRSVHQRFYERYERNRSGAQGGRLAQLKGEKSPKKRPIDDLEIVPDVALIMPDMKRSVLKGVSIVFSGVVPLGTNIQNSEYAVWAKSFGAKVSEVINRKTTHVVAARNRRTQKVRQAARHPQIKIVTVDWLKECFVKWQRAPEGPHIIHVEPDERGPHASQGSPFDELDEGTVMSSSEEDAVNAETDLDELGEDDTASDDDELDEMMPTSPVDEQNLRLDDTDREELEKELAEFLDESDTDGEAGDKSDGFESDASVRSETSVKTLHKKRKRNAESTDNSETSDSDSNMTDDGTVSVAGSKLQRRKKRALERVTSLTNVAIVEHSSGLPSPDTTGPEEGQGEEDASKLNQAEADEDDDALEAELLAEFEKDDDEEETEN